MLLIITILITILLILYLFYNNIENFTYWKPRILDKYNQWGLRDNRYWVFGKNYYYPLSNNINAINQHLTPKLLDRLLLNTRWYDGTNMYRYIPLQ